MYNAGLGFIAFGVMLLIPYALFNFAARKRLLTKATIIGYKQFPNDKTITSNEIYRGRNFNWLRVVEFVNPQTGQILQMFSNPGVKNPEPIGTSIMVAFDPAKADPKKDYVMIKGGVTASKKVGNVSLATGVILYITLLFIPSSSPLQFVGVVAGFAVVFVTAYIYVWRRPNQ